MASVTLAMGSNAAYVEPNEAVPKWQGPMPSSNLGELASIELRLSILIYEVKCKLEVSVLNFHRLSTRDGETSIAQTFQ